MAAAMVAAAEFGALQNPVAMECWDNGAVFFARAVRPLVEPVCVHAERDKQPDVPREEAERPHSGLNQGTAGHHVPRVWEIAVRDEGAGIAMVSGVLSPGVINENLHL